ADSSSDAGRILARNDKLRLSGRDGGWGVSWERRSEILRYAQDDKEKTNCRFLVPQDRPGQVGCESHPRSE
ncbi:MAG: hypothetical protein WAM59_06015, partial [Candidatus Acidiferrales bacterium]